MNKSFFTRDAGIVAKELLGKILMVGGKKAKIVETEAYFDEKDPASRACQNGDLKKTMEMEAGRILVYGVHNSWLINIVTGKKGEAGAVLIRAVEPLNFNGDCKGPGKLTKCLNIDKRFHKKLIGEEVCLDDGFCEEIEESFRIGVKKDLDKKMRFYIKDNKWVSR